MSKSLDIGTGVQDLDLHMYAHVIVIDDVGLSLPILLSSNEGFTE